MLKRKLTIYCAIASNAFRSARGACYERAKYYCAICVIEVILMIPKTKDNERIRGFMYVQQIPYLKIIPRKDKKIVDCLAKQFDEAEEKKKFIPIEMDKNLKKDIDKELVDILDKTGAQEWAFVLHDKDKEDNGMLKAFHYHVFFYFKNGKTVNTVAKYFNDDPERFEKWKYSKDNAYSYLIHETAKARKKGKYHYEDSEVIANFNYHQKMEQIRNSVKASKLETLSKKKVLKYIQLYASGGIDRTTLEEILGTYYMADNKALISNIDQDLAVKKHKKFVADFQGKCCYVFWLYGESGVGKTRMVRDMLTKTHKGEFCILGSSKDYFQEYQGENYIVINDLRPNEIKYGDLLKLLDPYEHDKKAGSRYHDKLINAKQIYITTPYSPYKFWQETYVANRGIDAFEQLKRRITAFKVTKTNAYDTERTLIILDHQQQKEINAN